MAKDKSLATKHEPYSLDLLNYEISASLGKLPPSNRFTGRRVMADSKRRKNILKRERRLRKYGMSVLMFAS